MNCTKDIMGECQKLRVWCSHLTLQNEGVKKLEFSIKTNFHVNRTLTLPVHQVLASSFWWSLSFSFTFVTLYVLFWLFTVLCCMYLFAMSGLYPWITFFWFPSESCFPWLLFVGLFDVWWVYTGGLLHISMIMRLIEKLRWESRMFQSKHFLWPVDAKSWVFEV